MKRSKHKINRRHNPSFRQFIVLYVEKERAGGHLEII